MRAAAARLLLASACLASAHEAQDVPIPPRTGLWAPRAQPKPRPKPSLLRKRSNLWSHMFEPAISTPFSKDEHAALTAPRWGRAPAAPRAAAPTQAPVMAHVATVPPPLLLPPPKPFEELYPPPKVDPALIDPALAPPAQPPPTLALARTDAHLEAGAATVEEDADMEASEEAMEVSDPILAKLDKINAALHAMRHPVDERVPHGDSWSARLGAAQLRQHVQKALLPPAQETPRHLPRHQPPSTPQVPPSKPAAPAPAAAPAAARSPTPPVPTIAPGTPLPGAFVAPPEPVEARPQLSMLRKQQSAHGLFNRLFDDSPAPKKPPPRKKVEPLLSLARVVGAVQRSAPVRWADHAREERSLAAAYR